MRTMRMEREDIENSLKVLSHIVDDDFIITVDEARKIIRIDGETIKVLQAKVERLQEQLPKRGEWITHPEVKNIYGGVYIECPFCGEKYVVQNVSDEKFCRNCGADMRKMEVQE